MAVPTTTLILLHFIYVLAVNAAYQNITVRMNDTRLEYYAMIVVGSGFVHSFHHLNASDSPYLVSIC